MSFINASFSFPQEYLELAERYGIEPLGIAGEFDSWNEAFDYAKEVVKIYNMPVEVRGFNMYRRFFPDGMNRTTSNFKNLS